jgi:hypothetical protein
MIKKINVLVVIILLLINPNIEALEFEKEADKSQWIKTFFKNKRFDLSSIEYEEEEDEKEMLKDFVTQKGIEHLEPIAVGKNIDDPEIKKFNIACPRKKPINVYKRWRGNGSVEIYPASEDELENPENQEYIDQYSCSTKMKIFKFNVFNVENPKEDDEKYILYCEDFRDDRFRKNKEVFELDLRGAYLLFDPNKCLYSQDIDSAGHPLMENYVSGIFKYKEHYYFYSIESFNNEMFKKKGMYIRIRREGNDYTYYYHIINEVTK